MTPLIGHPYALPNVTKVTKRRVDTILFERGLVESREKARAVVLAGAVTSAGRRIDKPGSLIDDGAVLELAAANRYVGRGGEKLEGALAAFGIAPEGMVVADIGSSTGGFTDCLLQRGARRVYAIDVGYGQLDYRLRTDSRVVVMERVNARYLESLPEPIDLVTMDVSFISLTKILPAVRGLLGEGGRVLALLKPQFEGLREDVGRGGLVRDPLTHARILGRFVDRATREGWRVAGPATSAILGQKGNREFFLLLTPYSPYPKGDADAP